MSESRQSAPAQAVDYVFEPSFVFYINDATNWDRLKEELQQPR